MIQETWYTNEIVADGFSSSVLEAEEEREDWKEILRYWFPPLWI